MDALGIPEFMGLASYWAKHPPLQLMVQHYLGVEGSASRSTEPAEEQGSMEEFLELFGLSGGQVTVVKEA